MSKTPTSTIAQAIGASDNLKLNGHPQDVKNVATRVRNFLKSDGWKVVKASKIQRLETVLEEIYVDNRRQRQVELLDEARKLAQSL